MSTQGQEARQLQFPQSIHQPMHSSCSEDVNQGAKVIAGSGSIKPGDDAEREANHAQQAERPSEFCIR